MFGKRIELTPEQQERFKNNMSYFWDGFQFGAMFGILLAFTITGSIWMFVINPILIDLQTPQRVKPIPGQWKVIPKEEKHIA